MNLLIGTERGVATVDGRPPLAFGSLSITGLAAGAGGGWWATAKEDGRHVLVRIEADLSGVELSSPAALNCVAEVDGEVLAGAGEGRLYRREGVSLSEDPSFLSAPGRDTWYTPWGGPPDLRSLAVSAGGVVFANVHVGGILRRDADGWTPTIDIDADVHQVATSPDHPRTVVAACARGLALSPDLGRSWEIHHGGLHARYARAAAIAGDLALVSVSDGPGGSRAAVYRARLDDLRFERCVAGLPEWFSTNVDSGCIAVTPDGAVHLADRGGTVYRSADGGESWEEEVSGLPPITVVAAQR